MSLACGKTESILFGSKFKLKSNPNLSISCNDSTTKSASSVKYLGVTIDQHLTFSEMVRSVIRIANSRLKYLYRKKAYLTEHTKLLLIQTLIQCHYDYACSIWYSGLSMQFKKRLQTTQNKLIRFILNLNCNDHIFPLHFKQLNWLPVNKRVEQIILCNVFKIYNGSSPKYFNEQFRPQNSLHNYETRLSQKGGFVLPRVKSYGSKSFSVISCSLWNKLPKHITKLDTLNNFKRAIKTHLFDNL